MATLTELTIAHHKNLKIAPNAPIEFAEKQHIINVSATEIANAATCFPVFATRNNVNGNWAFSAMTGFDLGTNLFVRNGKFEAVFQPNSLRTYPLYLMQSPKDPKQFTVGFDAQSDAFSETQGAPLFTDDGKATAHLTEVSKMLEAELSNVQLTQEFAQKLEKLNLFKALDLQVQYENGTTNTIKGLHTINEDVLKVMEPEQLMELNKAGYLTPMHALLISIFQLNTLISKNNDLADKSKVVNVKMEVSKEFTHA